MLLLILGTLVHPGPTVAQVVYALTTVESLSVKTAPAATYDVDTVVGGMSVTTNAFEPRDP